ncbi:MAG TPA: helix-turn-helix transcriptional regulator [Verrucomicrobiae bacterium]|nr:helix-turn-helix transcriptional regulator [Verrucomicrobiae bacterium]
MPAASAPLTSSSTPVAAGTRGTRSTPRPRCNPADHAKLRHSCTDFCPWSLKIRPRYHSGEVTSDVEKRSRREELRSFLKTCRARLTPQDVGLTSAGRRRVSGLRREEVAELSGMSLEWYTLLETAQDIRVSPRLLDRISNALRLNDQEKLQLFLLAIEELPW